MKDNFYKAFEDRYRGSRELISSRLEVYRDFLEPLARFFERPQAVDLGCGRGEFLEVLQSAGFQAHGVDLDEGMLQSCRQLGLSVEQREAVDFLRKLPAESQVVVSAFHLVEHLSFDHLRHLVSEALRVLKPGGLMILETPNPENLKVATHNFYYDPTHKSPIPPGLLVFVAEHEGFTRVKILRLQESLSLNKQTDVTMAEILEGVSPDYSIVAQKGRAPNVAKALNDAFGKNYGVNMPELVARFDEGLRKTHRDLKTDLGATKVMFGEMADCYTGVRQELEAQKVVTAKRAKELGDSLSDVKAGLGKLTEANLLDQSLFKGFAVELNETRKEEAARGQELRQELEAQKVAASKGVKELGDSLVGLKQELEAQKVATAKEAKVLGDSLAELKQALIGELRTLAGQMHERQDHLQQENLAQMDALKTSLSGHLRENERNLLEVAKYTEKIQDSVVSPSSYLVPAPFSWYSYLYKMLNVKKPAILSENKISVVAPKRPGFWRRLERSIRKRRKMLEAAWNFDPVWYLETYPEVSAAGVEPLSHYINFGKQEGRQKNKSQKGIGVALIRMVKALRKSSLTTAPEIFLEQLESAFWVVTLKQSSTPLEGLVRITARNRRDEVRLSGGSENKKDHRILLKLARGIQKISISFEDKYKIQKIVVTKITKASNAKESKPDNIVSQKYDTFVDLSVKPARATMWRQLEARLRNKRKAIFSKPLVTIQRQALNERGGFPAVALALNQQADKIFKEISRRNG